MQGGSHLASVNKRPPLPSMPVWQLHGSRLVAAVEGDIQTSILTTQGKGDQLRIFAPIRAACLFTMPLYRSRSKLMPLSQFWPFPPECCKTPQKGLKTSLQCVCIYGAWHSPFPSFDVSPCREKKRTRWQDQPGLLLRHMRSHSFVSFAGAKKKHSLDVEGRQLPQLYQQAEESSEASLVLLGLLPIKPIQCAVVAVCIVVASLHAAHTRLQWHFKCLQFPIRCIIIGANLAGWLRWQCSLLSFDLDPKVTREA